MELAARCPWVDVAVHARVALPGERWRVRSLQRHVELEYAAPVERRVLRQTRPRCLVERRAPVGAGARHHAGPCPVSDSDPDDAQAARGQLDRRMLLGIGPAEGNIHRPWAPADHVALVPAIDARAERLRPRSVMSAGRRERQQRSEQAEAATPPGSTQGSSRRSLHGGEHGAPAHRGLLSRRSTPVGPLVEAELELQERVVRRAAAEVESG